jgi:hypothetical protein
MDKKVIIFILIGIVVLAGAVFFFVQNQDQPPQENEIVYFYGEGCPHCVNVDTFVQENKIEEKVSYEKKEVFNNATNAEELTRTAQQCGLPANQVGVPLLYDSSNSKCYVGDVDVINFFKQKLGIQ